MRYVLAALLFLIVAPAWAGGISGCPTATTSQQGCVQPDGSTITISGGVISATTGGTGNVSTPGFVTGNVPIATGPNALGPGLPTGTTGAGVILQTGGGGKIASTVLPTPTASTLGGVQSVAPVTSFVVNSISTAGVPSLVQLSFSDILGTLGPAQQQPLVLNHIFIGNASNQPIDTPMSGDCTILASGAITCTKTNGVAFGTLATSSTITAAQMLALPSANIYVGNVSSQPTAVAMSGDCTITNAGLITCLKVNGVTFGPLATVTSIGAALDTIGATQGDILYRNASNWVVLAPGTSGQVLQSGGPAANPTWTSSPAVASGTSGQIQYNNGGALGGFTMAGDCTLAQPNITCTKTSGVSFGPLATSLSISSSLDTIGAIQGDILYRGVSSWVVLAPGLVGQVLQSGGAGGNPGWTNVSATPGGSTGNLQYNNGGVFGGFVLAGDCSLSVPNITCLKTGGAPFGPLATSASLTAAIDTIGNVQGDVLYRSAAAWVVLPPGTNGQVLKTSGPGADPAWTSVTATAGGTNGQIQYNSGGAFAGFTMAGDCTFSVPNITCTKTNGSTLGPLSTATSLTSALDTLGATQGDVLYRNATQWVVLLPGTAGQVLQTGGAAANPSWTTVSATAGGTSGQLQFNNAGALGGFTLAGDCTLLQPNITCTKTGGVSFGPLATSASAASALDSIGNVQGDILYRNASTWVVLAPGTAGQVLQSGGAAANPSWTTNSATAGGTNGQIQYNNAGTIAGFTMAGDCTLAQPNITCTKTNGTSFGPLATSTSISSSLDTIGGVQGDILYRNASNWVVLPPGTSGQVLQSGGAAANPSWTTVSTGAGGTTGQIQYNNGGVLGGFTMAGDCTLAQPNITCTKTGGSAFGPLATSASISASLDTLGAVQGDVLYRNASSWVILPPGSAGQVFQSGGPAANPSWTTISATAGGTNGQLQYNNGGSFAGFTMAGDCTLAQPNITCTKTNGVAFGALATENALASNTQLPTLTSGQVWVGSGTNVPTGRAMTGDCTVTNLFAITCTSTNGTPFGTAATANLGTSGGTVPLLNGTNTWSSQQNFPAAGISLAGATSGTTVLQAAAVASGTVTVPAGTDTLVNLTSTQTLTNKTINGGTISGTIAGSPTLSGTWNFTGTLQDSGFPLNFSAGLITTGTGTPTFAFPAPSLTYTFPTTTATLLANDFSNIGTSRIPAANMVTLPQFNLYIGDASNNPTNATIKSVLATAQANGGLGNTRGTIAEVGSTGWATVGPGTTGQCLISAGASSDPSFQTCPGTGSVTVNLGTGLTNVAGTQNVGTQFINSGGTIFPQNWAATFTTGSPHSVLVGDGVQLYVSNAGSSYTFALPSAAGGGSGAAGTGYCFEDRSGNGIVLTSAGGNFVGTVPSGTTTTLTLAGGFNAYVCPTSDGTNWQTAVTFGVTPEAYGGTGESTYTDGQILIGSTSSGGLTKTTLTAGSGINVTNGSGSITVAAATGTSGATLPFLNGTNTWSGTQTFGTTMGTVVARAGTTDTLAAADCGKTIEYTSATAVTVTLPNNLGIGCHIAATQGGAGQVTFTAQAGGSLVNRQGFTKTAAQYAGVGLSVIENAGGTAAKWFLFGDGA